MNVQFSEMDSKTTRTPLQELKNVQPETRAPQTMQKRTGISRKSITKPSALPAPSSRRQTTTRVKLTEKPEQPPVPSRMTAKPKRAANSAFRSSSRVGASKENVRRNNAAVNFTSTARTASNATVLGRRPAAANARGAAKISDKMDSLATEFAQVKEEIKTQKSTVPDEWRQMFENMTDQISSSQSDREKFNVQFEETLKLKGENIELQARCSSVDDLFKEEQKRCLSLQDELKTLREKLQHLENEQKNCSQVSQDHVESLEKGVSELQARCEAAAQETTMLQNQITEQRKQITGVAHEKEIAETKLRNVMQRVEKAEFDLSNRELELRKLSREKENLETERNGLENNLSEKNSNISGLQDQVHALTKTIEAMKAEGQQLLQKAAGEMQAYQDKVISEMDNLRSELSSFQQANGTLDSHLKQRDAELAAVKQVVSLQERKISQMKGEKYADDARIDVLQGDLLTAKKENGHMKSTLEHRDAELATLERQARADASEMRKLRNTIQELKGNIRVFARVRPLLPSEEEKVDKEVARSMFEYKEMGQGIVAKNPTGIEKVAGGIKMSKHPFKFDKVFNPKDSQDNVFEEISQLVQSALDGYRVCIFAYGQTGSGKTYTMLGNGENGGKDLGMIPRSVRQVFETARGMEKDDWELNLKASFLEIYNENLRDLLTDSAPTGKGKSRGKDEAYKIHFDGARGLTVVNDLTVVEVKTEEEMNRLIQRSMRKRATAATKANEQSSRSHCVFRLYITGQNKATGETRTGLLNLIDLAGSERLSHSKAEGERLRETRNINKSLSSLGDVISALSKNEKHVPFRNSKLTYLLQDSLGGNSKTLMFVNISHAVETFHESLTSLRFAQKVNSCHIGTARKTAKFDM